MALFFARPPPFSAPITITKKAASRAVAAQLQAVAKAALLGLLFSGSAAAIRLALMPLTGAGAPYLVFFGAVLVAGSGFGWLCGMFTALLSGCAATYLFTYRAGFSLPQLTWQAALFFCEAGSVAWLSDGFFSWRRAALSHLDALRASEERYQLALRATSDLIRDWRPFDDQMHFGDGLVGSLGYANADRTSTGTWWLDHVHEDDRERVEASLTEAALRHKTLWAAEYRFRCADGSFMDISDNAYLVYDEHGALKRLIGAMQNITQRRNDQRVLQAAEGRLRLITDALPAIVLYLDEQRRHRFVNAEWERWFQKPRAAVLGKTVDEWVQHNFFANPLMAAALETAMQGESNRIDGQVDLPGRGTIPVTCTFVPDLDESNQTRGVVCLIRDISEQKHNERSLKESEEHYRVLAEVVPQIIFEARSDGAVAYTNSRLARYTGLLPEQLLGQGWLAAVHPAERQQVRDEWEHAVSARHEYETELLLYCAHERSWRWHMLRALALTDEQGEVRRWLGCLVDIHERKKVEQELQTLADFIPQLAWVANPQGEVYWLNRRWRDYSGRSLDQLSGQAWLDSVPTEQREDIRGELQRAFGSQQPFEGTFPLLNVDGAQRWFLTRAIPIIDDAGHVTRWFGTSTDINDQLEAQTRLEDAQAELQTAVRARDEFMSIASHELKTPLTSLQLVAQMAERNLRRDAARACEPQRVRKLVTQTEKSVERLNRLVDDMLDSSRIAMGKLSFKFEDFDLAELVREVVERIMPQVQASGGSLRIVGTERAFGRWDRFRIEQVVLNLLTNALRYGAGTPIEVGVNADDSRAWFSIKDHGPGIAHDHQERIFQQYERATPHSSISGLGLGLYICREIVERHGGEITLQSRPGSGAAFEVLLPKHSEEAMQAELAAC